MGSEVAELSDWVLFGWTSVATGGGYLDIMMH